MALRRASAITSSAISTSRRPSAPMGMGGPRPVGSAPGAAHHIGGDTAQPPPVQLQKEMGAPEPGDDKSDPPAPAHTRNRHTIPKPGFVPADRRRLIQKHR